MAKIGILLPWEKMRLETLDVLKEMDLDVVCCRTIETADTLNEARRAVEEGAQLIVARGYQARILKERTKIPLVEIQFTMQEVGLLLQQAKKIAGKPHPHVAIIAFENMLPDTSHMALLMDVELTISYIEKAELVDSVFVDYEKNRPDIVIGGEVTCAAARERGYLTLFYHSTSESIREALHIAERMSFAIDSEQQHTALFETVLDTSFNPILQINAARTVISVNHNAELLLEKAEEEILGQQIDDVLGSTNLQALEKVLAGRQESVATSLNIQNEAYIVLMAAVSFEERITGAVLSFRQLSAMSGLSRQAKRELLLSGHRTMTSFRDLAAKDPGMKRVLDMAEVFALSDSPVLLYEEEGNEASMIARAIHNNSSRRAGPFVSIDIRDLYPEEQVDALLSRKSPDSEDARFSKSDMRAKEETSGAGRFSGASSLPSRADPGKAGVQDRGEDREKRIRGAMVIANHGTLFINRIERLTLQAQHQLLRTILPWTQMHTDVRPIDALDVRIIACAKHMLLPAVEEDAFSEELYYHFSGLTLRIPPLEKRPEDLKDLFREKVQKYTKKYGRHMQLTEDGIRLVPQLRWPGGEAQVDAFCERLVLSSAKRRLDDQMIRDLFSTLYPEVRKVQGEQRLVVYEAPQAQQIRDLLEKHGGDRNAVAKELGISKTTLWRHMKKYNVTARF